MGNKSENYLVLGGDGLLGRYIVEYLTASGKTVLSTTRCTSDVGDNRCYLDLSAAPASYPDFDSIQHVFLCAGVTSMIECEKKSASTRKINVDGVLAVSEKLVSQGARLYFLSSNTVFNGMSVIDESSTPSPTTEYGRQKAEAETALLKMSNVSVIRLSKVLSATSGMASDFIRKLKNGDEVDAFNDVRLSPISLKYVCESLLRIAEIGATGIFHLSGDTELTYTELAGQLASRLNIPQCRIRPVSSLSKGVEVLYKPIHPALRMERTHQLLGISPEPLGRVLDQLIKV